MQYSRRANDDNTDHYDDRSNDNDLNNGNGMQTGDEGATRPNDRSNHGSTGEEGRGTQSDHDGEGGERYGPSR